MKQFRRPLKSMPQKITSLDQSTIVTTESMKVVLLWFIFTPGMFWSTTFKTRQKLSFWFYSCLGQPSSSFHRDYRSDFIRFPSMFWSTILSSHRDGCSVLIGFYSMFWSTILSSHRDGRSVLIGFYSVFWSTMFKATHQFLYRRRR